MNKDLENEINKYKTILDIAPNYWNIQACQGIKYASLITSIFPIENYQTVLDVGCGPGHLIEYLAKKHNYYTCGIEPALDTIPKIYDNQSSILKASADDIPYEDKCVDLLINTDVLEHISEKYIDKTLQEFGRVAKKAIFLVISLTNSILNHPDGDLHITVKPVEWWINKIQKNINGKVKIVSMNEIVLIVKIELTPIIEVENSFTDISKVAKIVQNYKEPSEFFNLRNILTIQNYNAVKNLDYKNILDNEEKIEKILLLGAGPGFSENIDKIKQLKEEGYSIWGCNHVVKGLIENNIEPDYIFGLETREVLLDTLMLKDNVKFKNIVLHSACHPRAFQKINAENKWVYYSKNDDNPINDLFLRMNEEKSVVGFETVSSFMLEIARLYNPKFIKTIGYDFYIKDIPYDKSVPVLNENKFVYEIKQPTKAITDNVEYLTTWLYKKFAYSAATIIAKMKILNPEIRFERIGYSPLKFDRKDDFFLEQFKENFKIDYYELLNKYSLLEILNFDWLEDNKNVSSNLIDIYRYCIVPDKILNNYFNETNNLDYLNNFDELSIIRNKIFNLYQNFKISDKKSD